LTLPAEVYLDKVHGAWQATMVANHTGLQYEGKYLAEPNPANAIELALLEQWPTDDDTAVEWVAMHILETHGLEPTYTQIRDEWVDHLNHDIWVSTRRARELMAEGILPPDTGSAALNPDGVWSIDAQLQTELFGLIAPGLPQEAARRAVYFARVTNSGLAVDASAFYAMMYALAFFEPDVPDLITKTQAYFPADAPVNQIVDQVTIWYRRHPADWRATRRLIRDQYDDDPEWWAAKVNFASTIMALLYGQGDLLETMTIASLAGWDADNNATTAAGLLGLIYGFQKLPEPIRTATDLYYNEDVTGDLPKYQTIPEFAARTQALAEAVIQQAGGEVRGGVYLIPRE
jgi:ADP-ribosylglycohydrolase